MLHVPLAFNASAVAPASGDVVLNMPGTQPAIVFEDEAAANPTTALSLYKPDGLAELHLLGGRLLHSDGTDARWHCGTGTPASWSAPPLLASFEFGLPADPSASGIITLASADGQLRISLAAHYDSGGAATLTAGGASRFVVEGVDVRERSHSCASPSPPGSGGAAELA